VCFSTSEIYGRQAIRPKENDDSVIGSLGNPHWTYASAKLAEEHLAIAYHQEKGLPTTVLRPFNVYGPGQVGDGALRTFILHALKNEPLEIHRDGTQIRSWCYVDDMIDALSMAIENPNAIGESFNIGNPKTVITIYGLAKTVIRELNSSSSIIFTDNDYTDVDIRIPAVQKSYEFLDFEPRIDLEEGIRRTADFYRTLLM
jgi:UDP-glucose 4-epimerase